MSTKRFGCAIIVDAEGSLAGIITDGDLRRNIGRSSETLAAEVMTRKPRTIAPDALLADALEIMDTSEITVLIVVEGRKPVGLVKFLDLLRKGVA